MSLRVHASFHKICLLLLASGVYATAQTPAPDPPLSLQDLSDYLKDPTLQATDIPLILQDMQRNGIDFFLDQAALEKILTSATAGRRANQVTASVILQVLRSCADCRTRYFGPLSKDELLSLLRRKIPARALLDEVRLRTVKDIALTETTVGELAANGAQSDLIDVVVPGDKIEVPAPAGYARLNLTRGEGYNRYGAGSLNLRVDVIGKVEVLFVNNALFYRPLPNTDKKAPEASATDLGSTFNAPAPSMPADAMLESVSHSEDRGKISMLVEKGKPTGGKNAKVPMVEYAQNLVPGRNGFRIIIDEPDKKQSHAYELHIAWPGSEPPKR